MIDAPADTPFGLILDAVTYIGLIVSIFCLLVTIVSYLGSKLVY